MRRPTLASDMAHRGESMQGGTQPTAMQLLATFALFLIAALGPRIAALLAGVAYADDFGHDHEPHLQSYRPLLAAELWLWQRLFGPEFLMEPVARVLSGVWLALALTCMVPIATRIGCGMRITVAVGVVALLHPASNEFILWGVLESSNFNVALACAGASLVVAGTRARTQGLGLVMVAVSGAGNQLVVPMGCAVVLLVWIAGRAGLRGRLGKPLRTWALLVGVAPLAGVLVLLFMRHALNIRDFGDRSLGLESDLTSFLRAKFYVVSNALANVYQAPLAKVVGQDWTLRAFWPVALGVPLGTLVLLYRRADRDWLRAPLLALALPAAFAVVLSPLVLTQATPTGFRILIAAVPILMLGVSLTVSALTERWGGRPVALVLLGLAAFASAAATHEDVNVRVAAQQRDERWTQALRDAMRSAGATSVALCDERLALPASDNDGILVSYRPNTKSTYSVWASGLLPLYLAKEGILSLSPAERDRALTNGGLVYIPLLDASTGIRVAPVPGRPALMLCDTR